MIRACFSTAGTELEARTHGAGGSGQTGGSHSQAVTNQQQQSSNEIKVYKIFSMFSMSIGIRSVKNQHILVWKQKFNIQSECFVHI